MLHALGTRERHASAKSFRYYENGTGPQKDAAREILPFTENVPRTSDRIIRRHHFIKHLLTQSLLLGNEFLYTLLICKRTVLIAVTN